MARRKKQLPILENISIEGASAEGKAVARIDGKVTFIKGAVPGDVVNVQISKSRKSYDEGYTLKLVSPSKDRVEPKCAHFGTCGGCKWQSLDYKVQLHYKQQQVVENFRRIGHVEVPEIQAIVPSPTTEFYRNKLEYTFSNKRWFTDEEVSTADELNANGLGFHIPGRFDRILNVDKCWLMDDFQNNIRNFVRDYALEHDLTFFDLRDQHGLLRNLVLRKTNLNQWMVIVAVFHQSDELIPLLEAIDKAFPEIHTLMYVVNEKKNDTLFDQDIIAFTGPGFIEEDMEGIRFKIGPKSFFQTNSDQALKLYEITREFAGLSGNEVVYDLYTGTGTIANFVAKEAKSVIGIEYIEPAIVDARENSENNGISNTVFYAGDMKDLFNAELLSKHGQADVIITDPPRAGMHPEVIDVLLESNAKKIVYVSCNPATQARDLELLDPAYRIIKVQPVDMFPHTHHVENVVLLEKRS